MVNTFGNIIAAKEKEGEARGLELGEARGEKGILVQFVAEFWGDDAAARFAQQLDGAAPTASPRSPT